MKSMRLHLLILTLLANLGSHAAVHESEFAAGRISYARGEFKKAAAHFRRAVRISPNEAEPHYWLGMSYQGLADIATPFGGRYNSKARIHLTRAMELAPNRPAYRRALFDFLIDSADSSRGALRQAARLLQAVPEGDPDYAYMRRCLDSGTSVNSSGEARLGRFMLAGPRAVYSIGALAR
jgi:tetratricopeptide (TPR) repeat protein